MRALRVLIALAFLALAAGCASTPEAKLKQGYQTASGSVRAGTILVQRHAITPDEGDQVLTLGNVGKQALDGGKAKLAACRADEAAGKKVDCSAAVSAIDLGSGVLLELERFLDAREKGAK